MERPQVRQLVEKLGEDIFHADFDIVNREGPAVGYPVFVSRDEALGKGVSVFNSTCLASRGCHGFGVIAPRDRCNSRSS